MCFLCNSRFKSSLELMLCVIDISTLNKTYLICYIPVHELCKSLSSVVCEILPADHALTGYDTTSSFFGIGKNSMFKALKEPPNQFSDLSRIE